VSNLDGLLPKSTIHQISATAYLKYMFLPAINPKAVANIQKTRWSCSWKGC